MRYVRECTKADKAKNKTKSSDLNIFLINDKLEDT